MLGLERGVWQASHTQLQGVLVGVLVDVLVGRGAEAGLAVAHGEVR